MSEAAQSNGDGRPTRDSMGRYLPGNNGGPGNPAIKNLALYRKAVQEATDIDKVKAAWVHLQDEAANGEPWAIRELLDRVFGKAKQVVIVDESPGAGQHEAFYAWFRDMMERPRVLQAIETEMLEGAAVAPPPQDAG